MLWDCLARQVARADHDVGAIERADDRRRERRVVLSVRIDGKNRGRAFLERGVEAGAQRRALAAILVELDGLVGHRPQKLARAVGRSIVDSDDPGSGQIAPHVLGDLRECRFGVVRREYYHERLDQLSVPFSSCCCPSSIARIERRSLSIDSTACESSAARATVRSSPLFLYSSIFCRAPSIVYFSV